MATDAMSINERYQYLRRMQKRYQQADRERKGQLLDEVVAYTGLHRKSVVRRMSSSLERPARRREREKTYGPEVDAALAIIWETLDYICALRLQPNLVSTGQLLARHHELLWSPTWTAQLAAISVSSVARHLPPLPPEQRRRKPPHHSTGISRRSPRIAFRATLRNRIPSVTLSFGMTHLPTLPGFRSRSKVVVRSAYKPTPCGASGFGPKCLSITIGSVVLGFLIVTPSCAARQETKYSSWVSCPKRISAGASIGHRPSVPWPCNTIRPYGPGSRMTTSWPGSTVSSLAETNSLP